MTQPVIPTPPVPIPQAAPATTERVNVYDPSGALQSIPIENAEAALRDGYRLEAPSEAQGRADRAAVDDTLGALATGTTSAARALSFGLSDKAIIEGARAIDGDAQAETVRRRMAAGLEVNPTADTLGTAAGFVAPLLVTGGASGAAKGAQAATALPRGVSALGMALERGTAGLIGEEAESIALRALQRGAASGLGASFEGAAVGVGQAYSEDVLGNHETTAESLLAGAESGALMGFVLGGAFGGAGGALSATKDKAFGLLGRRGGAKAVDGILDGVAGKADDASPTPGAGASLAEDAERIGKFHDDASKLGVKPEEANAVINNAVKSATDEGGRLVDDVAESFIKRSAAGDVEKEALYRREYAERARKIASHDEVLDKHAKALIADGTEALKAEQTIAEIAYGDGKDNQMRKLVDRAKFRESQEAAATVFADAKRLYDDLLADPTRGGGGQSALKLGKQLQKLELEIQGALKPTVVGKTGDKAAAKFAREAAPARLFSAIDDFNRAVGKEAKFGKSPFGLTEAAKQFDDLYHRNRSLLADENYWGAKAANAQREVNAATTGALSTMGKFEQSFVTEYGSQMGRPIREIDPQKATSFLSGIDRTAMDLTNRAAMDWTIGLENRMAAVERNYAMTTGEKAQFAATRKSIERFRSTVEAARKDATDIAAIKKLHAEEQASSIGGVFGMIVDAGTSPMRTLNRLAALRRANDKAKDAIKKGVDGFFTGTGKAEKGSPLIKAEKGETRTQAYERFRQRVAEAVSDPSQVANRISERIAPYAQAAPRTAAAVAQRASRIASNVMAKTPPTPPHTSLTPHLEKPRAMEDAKVDAVERYASTANNPFEAVKALQRQKLTRDHVQSLKDNWPQIHAALGAEVMDKLVTSKAKLPYEKRIQLGILLGVPADAFLEPSNIKALQDTYAQQQPSAQPGSVAQAPQRPLKLSPAKVQTTYQAVEAA